MINITESLSIDESKIHLKFIRASGPGGQKVNKTVTNSSLPVDVRERLISLAGRRITAEGSLVIDAQRFRLQEQNRQSGCNRQAGCIDP